MVNFLKNLFGAGGGSRSTDRGIYLYVQPKMCQEILRIRVDPMNDLSRRDEGSGYWVRKVASGHRCPFQAEVEIYFDKNKRITDTQVSNGKLVSEDDWQAHQAGKNTGG